MFYFIPPLPNHRTDIQKSCGADVVRTSYIYFVLPANPSVIAMWCRKRFFAYPQMVDVRKRAETMQTLPLRYRRRLVEAGFFAAHLHKRFLCYCCGLELLDTPVDPWHEHVRCNPTCHHVAANTSLSFRQRILDNVQPLNYPWEGNLRFY
jgi:hypothetical protein